MTEECSQYLAQLQKDWERQRVKMGVEALKKEVSRILPNQCCNLFLTKRVQMSEREGSGSSRGAVDDSVSPANAQSISASNSAEFMAQRAVDDLFSRISEKSEWQPAKPPIVLGELLDSRHMLPLLLPSDPIHLGALPVIPRERSTKRESDARGFLTTGGLDVVPAGMSGTHDRKTHSRSGSRAGSRGTSIASVGARGAMEWLSRTRKLRVVDRAMLKHLGDDEAASELEAIAAKWQFAWHSTLAATAAGAVEQERQHEGGGMEENMENGVEYPKVDPEPSRAVSPRLTLEPPRLVKESRRRASEAE